MIGWCRECGTLHFFVENSDELPCFAPSRVLDEQKTFTH